MSNLSVAQHDLVRLVTVDDGKANALSADLIEAIGSAVADAESDASTKAVVLAGREGRFSAGFDLSVMRGGDVAAMVHLVADGGALVRQVYGAGVPVVAACTGHAVAAGALLLLGCDVRIGSDASVKIGLNEVAIGMVLPNWAQTIARVRLTPRWVERCVANAQLFDGAGAVEAGFLDEVVPPASVVDRAMEVARDLCALDPSAYRGTMASYRGATLAKMENQIAADRAAAA
ncbi:MAG TPA: crotonase/enoyl-CoA hydratase family protein [Acidimicrobiia bacterium]|jgi:enoyl-CoA hydratase|nr:crotonase/enoyl-CoA hydratase family protein [Acidimicrobiia bacterium]